MAGTYSPNAARPLRPGAYFDFEAQTPQPVFVNTLGIVGLAFTHNWGPANKLVPLNSFADFLSLYGDGGAGAFPPVYTKGYTAMRGAFQGEGVPGRGGAGQVLGYRMVGASGKAASKPLTGASGAALTVSAKYPGSYGGKITIAVVVDANVPTDNDLNVYVNGFLVESWVHGSAAGQITALAANINAHSVWLTASAPTDGGLLDPITTPAPLLGGDDGSILLGTDYSTMMAQFGTARYGTFALEDVAETATWTDTTGSSVLTSLMTWQKYLNSNGRRFMTIVGGSAADTLSSAAARSQLIDDPNVINLGIGSFNDSAVGPITTSQLAPRLAGIIAARTERMGLSFARLAGLDMVQGAQDSDILASLSAGFMTVSRDSNADSPLRFEKGLTSFVDKNDNSRPQWAYSNPKFVITMQNLENELTEWAESNVVGLLPVDPNSVSYVIGNLKTRLKQRENDQIIQPGWSAVQAAIPVPTPQDDFLVVQYGISFTRDMEQLLNRVIVS